MQNDPLETAELLAFTKTIECQSISRAAAELGIPRATLGRRLARLEERLGARLVRRTTRSLALTDAGATLHVHARRVLDAAAEAEASVRSADGTLRGDLRVSVPPYLMGFPELVAGLARRHPGVRLQVHFSTRHVDLQRDGYDVAIRAGTELEPGLVARTLMRTRVTAVASPEYLRQAAPLRSRRDLARHRLLLGFTREELPQSAWPLRGGGSRSVTGTFASNDLFTVHHLARAGLGIAMLPELLVASDLRDGALVAVLPEVLGAESRMVVVYAERELVPPTVRMFIDAVVAWAPANLKLPDRC
ncbi:MAG: LysR family transcriptional regulator [Myxococcales bacterium]|nr:LysR family transcriptional regulator [Myxococcales bacterium]